MDACTVSILVSFYGRVMVRSLRITQLILLRLLCDDLYEELRVLGDVV